MASLAASLLRTRSPSLLLARQPVQQHAALFATGTVKWFDTKKGFGFIVPDAGEGDSDLFVHQSNIHADGFRSLAEGEAVVYDIESKDDGKLFATNVTGPDGDYVKGASRDDEW